VAAMGGCYIYRWKKDKKWVEFAFEFYWYKRINVIIEVEIDNNRE
jgi:hypothetical protein